ncbi:MAG: hypothetical protein WCK70_16685, partial [Chloroflexales bacterium]
MIISHTSIWRRIRIVPSALLLLAVILATFSLSLVRPAHAAGVIYVVPGGAGVKDGTSWVNAKDLAAALSPAPLSGTEIWVKAGTYKP